MFGRKKFQPWLTLTKPELEEPILEFHSNESGKEVTRYAGRRYLVGNYVVMEFADGFDAAKQFADMSEVEQQVKRDLS